MELCKKAEELLEQRGNELKEMWQDETWMQVVNSEAKSPIEQLFLIEWYFQVETHILPSESLDYYILPQAEIQVEDKKFKVDFLAIYSKEPWLKRKNESVIVELDSYTWHGSTPEQFAREKERERELAKTGYRILRFSGREIIRDIGKCVEKVLIFLSELRAGKI